jgi:hypothetical protein
LTIITFRRIKRENESSSNASFPEEENVMRNNKATKSGLIACLKKRANEQHIIVYIVSEFVLINFSKNLGRGYKEAMEFGHANGLVRSDSNTLRIFVNKFRRYYTKLKRICKGDIRIIETTGYRNRLLSGAECGLLSLRERKYKLCKFWNLLFIRSNDWFLFLLP